MKFINVAVIAICVTSLHSCIDTPATPVKNDTSVADPSKGDIGSLAKKVDKPATAWQYSDDEDKLTSKKVHFAQVDAIEELQLKFPYNGGVTATIFLRKRDGASTAMLQLSRGQFMTSVDGEEIRVRFDDGKPETFSCSESADNDSRVLFIDATSRFISKLRKSKNLVIEATLFDNGNQQMEFPTAGLAWDK
jgi:hypothetical protein